MHSAVVPSTKTTKLVPDHVQSLQLLRRYFIQMYPIFKRVTMTWHGPNGTRITDSAMGHLLNNARASRCMSGSLNHALPFTILAYTYCTALSRQTCSSNTPWSRDRYAHDVFEWNIWPWWLVLVLQGRCPIFKWSHCNSLEDRVPVDFIYGYPIFQWVAVTWQKW